MSMSTHKQYELKKIVMELYRPIIEAGNDIRNNENLILCYKNSKTGVMEKTKAFNNIDDFIMYIANSRRTSYCETYFNLYTSENDQRKTEYIKTACFIGLDFDRKDFEVKGIELNIDYIQSKFHELGLFYNLLVNSGNGIHVYIYIEPTQDVDLVVKVAKQIANRTGADINACKPTQLLRVPFTFNNKQLSEGIKKPVVLIHADESPMRKDINKIAKKLFRTEAKTIKTLKITNGCMKMNDLTTIPIEKGISRHEELLWLYGKLLQFNTTQGQIEVACDKFQELNNLEDYEVQMKWLKENAKAVSPCGGCKYKDDCHNYEEIREQKETDLVLSNTFLKKSCKKGAKKNMLKSNEILIYGIIYIQQRISIEGLIKEFTVKDRKTKEVKQFLSERTIRTCLKSMEEKGIVLVSKNGNKNVYSLKKPRRILEDQKIILSSAAIYERIKEKISEAEFQLYCFMKYLQWEQRNLNKINSNFKLKMTQKELASLYGITPENCNRLIQGLLDGKYISIAEEDIHKSSKNGYEYYTYTLLY